MPDRLRRRIRFLIVALLVIACSTTPSSAPPTFQLALLEQSWALGTLPSVAITAVHIDRGWVGFGTGCGGGCDSFDATALTSADGIHWIDHPLLDGKGVLPRDMTWAGDRLFALGSRLIRRELDNGGAEQETSAIVWRSTDGVAWEQLSTIDLGPCDDETCVFATTLSVSGDGVLVMGTTDRATGSVRGVYRSDDGASWTKVGAAAFGSAGPPFGRVDSIAVGSSHVLAGACPGCPLSVWSSVNGSDWTLVDTLPGPTPTDVDMATDGDRLILVAEACVRNDEDDACTMTLWSGPLAGPFTQTAMTNQLRGPRLAFVDGIFVLGGMLEERLVVYASTDGATWSEQPANLDDEVGPIADLAASPNELLLLTGEGLTGWLGRPRR